MTATIVTGIVDLTAGTATIADAIEGLYAGTTGVGKAVGFIGPTGSIGRFFLYKTS